MQIVISTTTITTKPHPAGRICTASANKGRREKIFRVCSSRYDSLTATASPVTCVASKIAGRSSSHSSMVGHTFNFVDALGRERVAKFPRNAARPACDSLRAKNALCATMVD
mmetsp:Transcript_30499/g.93248  ORF Transcript_30499/g.93248 Transcript_30499/m.93248 type:complete len:112 (-) Transcript_30499:291-626(-)